MLNSIIVMGRLTKEPSQVKSGETTIVNFDIAVDNVRKEADGTRGTTFLPVVCFNNIGESVCKHLHKGSKIAVEGSIQQRNFIRKDGTKGSAYEVIASSIEFLDPKPEEPVNPDEEPNEVIEEPQEPLFDPMTGKPLKPTKKK